MMNLPDAEQDFLRDLVKRSRQRPQHVRWVDRDGSERITTLSEADSVRLGALARKLGVGKDAVLREAAHLPARGRYPAPACVELWGLEVGRRSGVVLLVTN